MKSAMGCESGDRSMTWRGSTEESGTSDMTLPLNGPAVKVKVAVLRPTSRGRCTAAYPVIILSLDCSHVYYSSSTRLQRIASFGVIVRPPNTVAFRRDHYKRLRDRSPLF